MKAQITLGQVFGIKIGLHYSWFLIAFLIVFSLGADYRASHPQWPLVAIAGLAIATAVLFFLSLLLHELSHSLTARARGLPVHEITLFALGGVSQLGKEAASAKDEFLIAIVGPMTSAAVGTLCLGATSIPGATRVSLSPLTAMLWWLGYINLGLALFNMIPGYPMDGGRILRAALWWRTGNLERATRVAIRVGQIVAMIFIAIGIVSFFRGGSLSGLWIVFIGWFLLQAGRESYAEMALRKTLSGIKVSDLMEEKYLTVDGRESVQDFVDHTLLRTGGRTFLVTEDGNTVGLVTPHEVKHLDRPRWPAVAVEAVMRPWEKLSTIESDAPMAKALEIMGREDLEELPVVSNGRLCGVLSREKLVSYLRTLMEIQDTGNGHHRESI
jgi:Zn-dependent protease/predicted transcriptional regulator